MNIVLNKSSLCGVSAHLHPMERTVPFTSVSLFYLQVLRGRADFGKKVLISWVCLYVDGIEID